MKPRASVSIVLILAFGILAFSSCGVFKKTYEVVKGTLKATYAVTKGVVKTAVGAGKVVYKIGEFTFEVVKAPLDWPLTREDLESMDGLPPKEAIRQGRVKNAPYVVKGRRYVPMSVKEAASYREKGTASWY
ncbi:MAG: septal ring lytic transglycosylase RlpA family protein, partial [Deltaproteobacteria bacterium]|nr:septal ring lytic transglycosylase RlpA family protein [Deltaproteobacteria bacterium]